MGARGLSKVAGARVNAGLERYKFCFVLFFLYLIQNLMDFSTPELQESPAALWGRGGDKRLPPSTVAARVASGSLKVENCFASGLFY